MAEETLESLRSKIIASMGKQEAYSENGKRKTSESNTQGGLPKKPRTTVVDPPRGPKVGEGLSSSRDNVIDTNRSNRYEQRNPREVSQREHRSRFNNGPNQHQQQHQQQGRNTRPQGNRYNNTRDWNSPRQQRYNGNYDNHNNYNHNNNNYRHNQDGNRSRGTYRTRDRNMGKKNDYAVDNPNMKTAFKDILLYQGFTHSRLNCQLVIEGFAHDDMKSIEPMLNNLLNQFLIGLGDNMKLDGITVNSNPSNAVVLQFNSGKCTTMVFACRSFINKKLGLPTLLWRRPNGYIEQTDNLDRICSSNVIALENIKSVDDIARDKLQRTLGTSNFSVFKLNSMEKNGENEMEGVFTGCSLIILFDKTEDKTLDKLGPMTWFKPNESKYLKQRTEDFIFSNIPEKVKEHRRPDSKVLLLVNAVDPLDLKDIDFAKEIEETLKATLEHVVDITIVQPSVNYRLNFDHLAETAGNIYIRFETIDAAKQAMSKISGSKFNGRTILVSTVNEEDLDTPGILV